MQFYPPLAVYKSWRRRKFAARPIVLRLKGDWRSRFFSLFAEHATQGEGFFLDSGLSQQNDFSYFALSRPLKIFSARTPAQLAGQWYQLKKFFHSTRGPALPPGWPPFYGGALGVLSYDAGRHFEPGWKSSPPPNFLHFPLLDFGIHTEITAISHKTGELFLSLTNINNKYRDEISYQNMKSRLLAWAQSIQKTTLRVTHETISPTLQFPPSEKFLGRVEKIKKYIAQGDIYQANLSQMIAFKWKRSPLEFYAAARKKTPAPYSVFLNLPNFSVASVSPELLLKKSGLKIYSRPIAGTRPRGQSQKEDRRLAGELLLNEKERAEHVMLLDLERNDLGRVCAPGSVKVTERMGIERYSSVMHIVSQVEGTLLPRETIFSALQALFPGGTITGCPKIRCMQILDALEESARGPFYGSVGWVGFQGNGIFNLLIRTALFSKARKQAWLRVGAGIVADSIPEKEFNETLQKARSLLNI